MAGRILRRFPIFIIDTQLSYLFIFIIADLSTVTQGGDARELLLKVTQKK